MRGLLYQIARLLGDWQAITKNRISVRVKRRIAGYLIGKYLMRRIK